MFRVGPNPETSGHLLCLDCYTRFRSTVQQELAALAEQENNAISWAEAVAGVPTGTLPRRQIPQLPAQMSKSVFNNISVGSGAVVGAINTGSVQRLDVALDRVRTSGDPAVLDALKRLTQAVLADSEVATDKSAILDHIRVVAEQAAAPSPIRQSALARTVLAGLERMLNTSSDLATLWQTLGPTITSLF